ncbi:MAG: hypothetical protein CM15mP23_20480 [Cryomorphaceae bacterium]|nr:MAG: hypothetical protein CM15mP23_20480 [Cryomorphaceae bacterium]
MGEPENLGPEVNTEGQEMTPFLHKNGTLYFASKGHLGMGASIFLELPRDLVVSLAR